MLGSLLLIGSPRSTFFESFKEVYRDEMLKSFPTAFHKGSNFPLRTKRFGKSKYFSNVNIRKMFLLLSLNRSVCHGGVRHS